MEGDDKLSVVDMREVKVLKAGREVYNYQKSQVLSVKARIEDHIKLVSTYKHRVLRHKEQQKYLFNEFKALVEQQII